MSLSLSLGSFFSLSAEQLQGLQARGMQPNKTMNYLQGGTMSIQVYAVSPILSTIPDT